LQQERAEASFKRKEIQAREGAVATAEYNAATQAERAKTARLRALRLAKEEQDRKVKAAEPAGKGKAAAKKKR
jgi:hypothetical protein